MLFRSQNVVPMNSKGRSGPVASNQAPISIRALAERADVPIEAVLEELARWQEVERLEVSGDSVTVTPGGTSYPGMDGPDDEPGAPGAEPPEDEPIGEQSLLFLADKGDGGPAPGQSETHYQLFGRWSEEEQKADIARLATLGKAKA